MVCELDTEQNGLIQFSDSQCMMTLIDTTTAADCISTHPGIAFECTGDVECAHRDRCLNEGEAEWQRLRDGMVSSLGGCLLEKNDRLKRRHELVAVDWLR